MKKTATLTELQKHIADLCAERGWDKNTHEEKFMLFVEEVGELAKAIRNETQFEVEEGKKKPEKSELEEEFADVLNYLFDLANHFGVDLTKSFFEKHEKNKKRTWKRSR